MERAFKWLLPVLILAEILLVRAGLLDVTTAVGVVVGIEALLLLVGGRQIVVAVRRYRRDRSAGLDVWAALEDGLAVLLPRPVARVASAEPKIWICLWRWLFRRRPPGKDEFRYHKRSMVGPFLIVVLFTTPVELLLFELLIPWVWLRWVLIVLGVYALVWFLGFYASLVTLPHRLEASGIRLHYGLLTEGHIAYGDVARVERAQRRAPGGGDGLRVAPDENAAYLAVGGKTDVTLRLHSAQPLYGLLRPSTPTTTIHVAADEPERLVQELAKRIAVRATSPGE